MASRQRPSAATELSVDALLAEEAGRLGSGGGILRVAVVYPSAYSVAMASLGWQRLRRLVLDTGLGHVERAVAAPQPGRTLESCTPLGDFDLLLFSIAYEMDYPRVLDILDAAGIPLFASARGPRDPLVVAGGAAVMVNRHPLHPFADALAHGDAEDIVGPLLQAAAETPRNDAYRQAFRERLTTIKGIEPAGFFPGAGASDPAATVPGGETPSVGLPPVEPARCDDARRIEAVSDIVTPRAEFGRRVLVEIARGCPNHCTFCWMGCQRCTALEQPAERILALLDGACEATGCSDVGLIASAVGGHSEIDTICEHLAARGRRVSFSSLRAEEVRPSMLLALARSGQRGLTLAPEAGDESLRRSLAKNLSDARLLEVVDLAQQAGLEDLKLYFMLGLPGETDAHADAIARLTSETREILLRHGRPRGRLGTISVNLGIYVPKPGTPLARRPRPAPDTTRRRLAGVIRLLQNVANTRVAAASMEEAAAQTILANGALDAADLVYDVWKTGGRWRAALRRYIRRHPHALEGGGFPDGSD